MELSILATKPKSANFVTKTKNDHQNQRWNQYCHINQKRQSKPKTEFSILATRPKSANFVTKAKNDHQNQRWNFQFWRPKHTLPKLLFLPNVMLILVIIINVWLKMCDFKHKDPNVKLNSNLSKELLFYVNINIYHDEQIL